MFELHDIRNLVQHAGIIPSFEDVIAFKGYVRTFLENTIKKGYSEELDKLREASTKGKKWILDIEKNERLKTNIKNLKIILKLYEINRYFYNKRYNY